MAEIKLFNLLCKTGVSKEFNGTNDQKLSINSVDGKILRWDLKAEIFGFCESKDHSVNYSGLSHSLNLSKAKRNNLLPLFVGHNDQFSCLNSNLNANHINQSSYHSGVTFSDVIPNKKIDAVHKITERTTNIHNAQCSSKNSVSDKPSSCLFENFQKQYDKRNHNRLFNFERCVAYKTCNGNVLGYIKKDISKSHVEANLYNQHYQPDGCNLNRPSQETEFCHTLVNSNLKGQNHCSFYHDSSTNVLSPTKSKAVTPIPLTKDVCTIVIHENEKDNAPDKCAAGKSSISLPHSLPVCVLEEKHEICCSNEVNMLFLTKLFRQIFNLPKPRSKIKIVFHSKIQRPLKCATRKAFFIIENQLPVELGKFSYSNSDPFVHTNINQLATNSVNKSSYPNFTRSRKTKTCFRKSSYSTDIHNIRKWHSGRLKIKIK